MSLNLKNEIEERGHILVESVVCSLEFAGGEMEYGWGYLKYKQQRVWNVAVWRKLVLVVSSQQGSRQPLFDNENVITS